MSEVWENLITDIQKHCKNIDDFNKDILMKIDNKNKELIDILMNLFVKKKEKSIDGFFNPFDE